MTYCIPFLKNEILNKSTKAKILLINRTIRHLFNYSYNIFIHITTKYCLFRDEAILNIKILMHVNKASQTLYIKHFTQLQVIKI